MKQDIKNWMLKASKAQQLALASAAGTSRGHLYHLARGRRAAGPELARKLEMAVNRMRARGADVRQLDRRELCPACGRCEFAKAAKK